MSRTPKQPAHESTEAGAAQQGGQHEPAKTLWERTTEDPVAFWTLLLAFATGALALTSTVQIFFLTRADKTAQTSADAARDSADAAKRTVDKMHETAERQLRAYVSARFDYVFSFSNLVLCSARYTMKNHGHTPAHDLRNTAFLDILPYPLPANFPLPELEFTGHTNMILHPDQSVFGSITAPRPFTIEQIESVTAGGPLRLYMYGRVVYNDVFGNPRETRFCASVITNEAFVLCAHGGMGEYKIDYEPAEQHNYAT